MSRLLALKSIQDRPPEVIPVVVHQMNIADRRVDLSDTDMICEVLHPVTKQWPVISLVFLHPLSGNQNRLLFLILREKVSELVEGRNLLK